MFLVEPESGQRCHYRSARALGAAIRRGELGPRARIFHQTTNRWLPITVHPEYRMAESEWEADNARRWQERRWTFLAERPNAAPDAFLAERPDSAQDAMFAPIPSHRASTLVLIPGNPGPSWVGLAFRRLLQLARSGI